MRDISDGLEQFGGFEVFDVSADTRALTKHIAMTGSIDFAGHPDVCSWAAKSATQAAILHDPEVGIRQHVASSGDTMWREWQNIGDDKDVSLRTLLALFSVSSEAMKRRGSIGRYEDAAQFASYISDNTYDVLTPLSNFVDIHPVSNPGSLLQDIHEGFTTANLFVAMTQRLAIQLAEKVEEVPTIHNGAWEYGR